MIPLHYYIIVRLNVLLRNLIPKIIVLLKTQLHFLFILKYDN